MTQITRKPFERLVELLSEDMGFNFNERKEFVNEAERSGDIDVMIVTACALEEAHENDRTDEAKEIYEILIEMLERMGKCTD